MSLNLATLNVRGLRDPSKCARLLGELSNLSVELLQCKRLASFALRTVGCWRSTLPFFQHTAAAVALGSLCKLDAALMLMLTLFLQVTGAGWLWPMLPLKVSSSGWLWFMRPISLRSGFPFFIGWHRSWTIRSG